MTPMPASMRTFRNGSVTAVGIILGVSLGFLSQWATNPIAWSKLDIAAAIPIIVGGGAAGQGPRRPSFDHEPLCPRL